MASISESSLIAKLQSSDSTGIYDLVYDYIRPLADLSQTSESKPDQTLIRSLKKRFHPFLSKSMRILSNRLTQFSKSSGRAAKDDAVVVELFRVYSLCVDCSDIVSSESVDSFSVEFKKLKLMRCLEACGMVDKAEAEGLKILEKLRSSKSVERKGKILPEVDKGGVGDKDKELRWIILEIVVFFARIAVSAAASEGDGQFRRCLICWRK